jgi:soluble lytic murein transglycosylase-like protein
LFFVKPDLFLLLFVCGCVFMNLLAAQIVSAGQKHSRFDKDLHRSSGASHAPKSQKGETLSSMPKLLLFGFFLAVLTVSDALAQTRPRYVFDNFDARSGVTVYVPPAEIKANPKNKNVKKKQSAQNAPENNSGIIRQTAIIRASSNAPVMKMAVGKTLGSFSTGDSKIDAYVLDSANRHGVDPLLVYATMSQESSFKTRAVSYKGARGLMQLMPGTAARFGVTDVFDPRQNIEGGVRYLRFLLDAFDGDVKLALAGYNAGEGAVIKYGYAIPPYAETQDYVARISARYAMIRNPNYVRSVLRINSAEPTAKNTKSVKAHKPEPPPVVYEPTATAIKLPNGKIQLVSQ